MFKQARRTVTHRNHMSSQQQREINNSTISDLIQTLEPIRFLNAILFNQTMNQLTDSDTLPAAFVKPVRKRLLRRPFY